MSFSALTVDINARTKNFESAMDKVKAKTAGLEGSAKLMAVGLAAVGTAALATVGVLAKLTLEVANIQDEVGKTSQKIGIGVEALNELQYAASLADVSNEELTQGMTRLAVKISEAASGNKAAMATFDQLGVRVKNLDGSTRAVDEVFGDLAERFSSFRDGTNKTAQSVEIFGKAGMKMIPMLNSGKQGLSDAAKEARAFGVVFDEQASKAAEEFNDNITKLNTQLTGLKINIVGGIIPAVSNLLTIFNSARAAGLGFWDSLNMIPGPGADIDFQIKSLTEELGKLDATKKKMESGKDWGITIFGGDKKTENDAAMAKVQAQLDFLLERKRKLDELNFMGPPSSAAGHVPDAPPTAPTATDKKVSEAEQLIKAMQQQLYATQELTAEQAVLLRIEQERIALTPAQREQVMALARQTDVLRIHKEHLKDEVALDDLISQAEIEHSRTLEDLRRKYMDIANPMDKYLAQLEEIERLERSGAIGKGAANAAKLALRDDIDAATKGTAEELAEMKDMGKDLGMVFESSFEDAILSGEKFRDTVKAMIVDIGRLILRKAVIQPGANALIGLMGLAGGGTATAGDPYIVGERGPELFVPSQDGKVIPNKDLMGGGPQVHQTLIFNRGVTRGEVMAASQQATERAKRDIYESMRRNGVFAQAGV